MYCHSKQTWFNSNNILFSFFIFKFSSNLKITFSLFSIFVIASKIKPTMIVRNTGNFAKSNARNLPLSDQPPTSTDSLNHQFDVGHFLSAITNFEDTTERNASETKPLNAAIKNPYRKKQSSCIKSFLDTLKSYGKLLFTKNKMWNFQNFITHLISDAKWAPLSLRADWQPISSECLPPSLLRLYGIPLQFDNWRWDIDKMVQWLLEWAASSFVQRTRKRVGEFLFFTLLAL